MAKTAVVSVYLDQPAEISLHIAGRIVEPLSFLIRKLPRHGTLSGLRRTGRNSASILFTPDPAAGPCDDFFSFAAQSVDSPVSAPATVWMRIVERPPVLEHPEEIDFGKVYLGDRVERSMELKNSGGGVAAGKLNPNPPWIAGGIGSFRVPSGQQSRVLLVFEPLEERDFSDRIQLGADPKSFVTVRGSGIAPIIWPRDGLVFAPADRAGNSAAITFTNNTPAERTLQLDWPDYLKAAREVTLPPDGSAVMKVEIMAPLSFHSQGEVAVRSGNFKSLLPVTVFPAPAKLSIDPEHVLKLGETKTSRDLKGRFTVRNTGGSDAPLQILAPEAILISPSPANLILSGGQEMTFDAQMANPGSRPSRKTILIQSPACAQVELSVELSPPSKSGPALPVETFLNIPHPPEPAPAVEIIQANIPPVQTAKLLTSEQHSVEIGWQATSAKTSGFRIERRQISSGKADQVNVTWVTWPEVQIKFSGNTAVARFERLPANSFWTIRIIALDESGRAGPPSPAFQIATLPVKGFRLPPWAWLLLLIALAAAALHFWRRYQGSLHSRANERITRLGAE